MNRCPCDYIIGGCHKNPETCSIAIEAEFAAGYDEMEVWTAKREPRHAQGVAKSAGEENV